MSTPPPNEMRTPAARLPWLAAAGLGGLTCLLVGGLAAAFRILVEALGGRLIYALMLERTLARSGGGTAA